MVERVAKGSLVVIKGLKNATQHNFNTGVVTRGKNEEDRVVVTTKKAKLRINERNLLLLNRNKDRMHILLLQVWEYQMELRVARSFLLHVLSDNLGLCLHIASFWPKREGLMHFSGYNRRVLSDSYAVVPRRQAEMICFSWKSISPMPIPRIDCASVTLGYGRVLFAGGCSKHPQMCSPHEFLKSTVIYDSLADQWTHLHDCLLRRQGCSGVMLNGKVYLIGGEYVSGVRQSTVEVLDVASATGSGSGWVKLPEPPPPPPLAAQDHGDGGDEAAPPAALTLRCFPAVGAIQGRIVVIGGEVGGGGPLVQLYDPTRPELGWLAGALPSLKEYGACGFCAYRGHLVLAGGRGDPLNTEAFTIQGQGHRELGALDVGVWKTLPRLQKPRVGPALCVVHNVLYASGGVDEQTSEFTTSVERYEPGAGVPHGELTGPHSRWVVCEGLKMPTALHAHSAHGMPMLRTAQ